MKVFRVMLLLSVFVLFVHCFPAEAKGKTSQIPVEGDLEAESGAEKLEGAESAYIPYYVYPHYPIYKPYLHYPHAYPVVYLGK